MSHSRFSTLNPFGPNHCTICLGSVQAMNTRSRGAAITRHNTISRSGAHVVRESWDATGVTFRFVWLRGFDACEAAFETIEARLPRLSGHFLAGRLAEEPATSEPVSAAASLLI